MAKYSAGLEFLAKRVDNWNYEGSEVIKRPSMKKRVIPTMLFSPH